MGKKKTVTQKQLLANRKNAALSRGPVSSGGKLRSRRNALQHGRFATADLLLSTDADCEKYELCVQELKRDLQPTTFLEATAITELAVILVKRMRLLRYEGYSIEQEKETLLAKWESGRQKNYWDTDNQRYAPLPTLEKYLTALKEAREALQNGTHFENHAFGDYVYERAEYDGSFPQLEAAGNVDDYQKINSRVRRERVREFVELVRQQLERAQRFERSVTVDDTLKQLAANLDEQITELEAEREQRLQEPAKAEILAVMSNPELVERVVRYNTHLSKEADGILRRLQLSRKLISEGTNPIG